MQTGLKVGKKIWIRLFSHSLDRKRNIGKKKRKKKGGGHHMGRGKKKGLLTL